MLSNQVGRWLVIRNAGDLAAGGHGAHWMRWGNGVGFGPSNAGITKGRADKVRHVVELGNRFCVDVPGVIRLQGLCQLVAIKVGAIGSSDITGMLIGPSVLLTKRFAALAMMVWSTLGRGGGVISAAPEGTEEEVVLMISPDAEDARMSEKALPEGTACTG